MLTPFITQIHFKHTAQIMLHSGTGWSSRGSLRLHKISRCRRYATAGASPKQIPISNLETNRFLPYPKLQNTLQTLRRRLDRPLTLSEKLLYTHLRNPLEQELERGKSFLLLDPDRAACHDATATMAMLQFISAGLPRTMLPTSIHSDHLIVAENGAVADLANAKDDYAEVSLVKLRNEAKENLSDPM
jgi:aconitate hydratase